IHDSVQQGLSGMILQLDATLKLATLPPDVRSRLEVARKMVAFTRQEVQQAIWDLESPLLEKADLGDAIRLIAEMVTSGMTHVDFSVQGGPVRLDSASQHHLLRIAQEGITNAVRHSRSERIRVDLRYAPTS